LNWNKFFSAGAGLVVLTGVVLHQGQVTHPDAGDQGMLTGTALRDPSAAAAQERDRDSAAEAVECAAGAGDDPQAGQDCSDSGNEKRLAQNERPE
jgi:hypothetical protein